MRENIIKLFKSFFVFSHLNLRVLVDIFAYMSANILDTQWAYIKTVKPMYGRVLLANRDIKKKYK